MKNTSLINRREFVGGGLASVTALSLGARRAASANERVTIGLIGCGGRGLYDLNGCLSGRHARVGALCDVDRDRLAKAHREVGEKFGTKPANYSDYRELLDDPEIDAVIVATPDHWHAIMTIDACRAGKDVYVEKPLGHTIQEGRAIVIAAERYNRLVQVGLQHRSATVIQAAARIVQSGEIGRVSVVHAWNVWNMKYGPEVAKELGKPADTAPPDGVDYDMWLGPAPERPFNHMRFHWNYLYFWDYSAGMPATWGVHLIDSVHEIMRVEAPLAVSAAGGKHVIDDIRETPDTFEAVYDYPGFTLAYSCRHGNAFSMSGRARNDHGIQFMGTEGTLLLDRAGYEVIPEDPEGKRVVNPPGLHAGNSSHLTAFVDCVRTRATPPCTAEQGHRSTSAVQLGTIAFRTGKKIRWDAENERIEGDPEASRLLGKAYRAPWKLPT